MSTLAEPSGEENVYETDANRDMYLGLHYPNSGETEQVDSILLHDHMPVHGLRFPQRVAELLVKLGPKHLDAALDIGCAVGGSSFALAQHFAHVDGFDYSHSFVDTANQMKRLDNNVTFRIPIEADIHKTVMAVHEPGTTKQITSKVNFLVGDACQLDKLKAEKKIRDKYDGVLLANLLCRLPDPRACLDALPEFVNPGGVVVVVTPYSWLEQFTPRSKWLGGYYESSTNQEPVYSRVVLKQ